MRFYLGQLDHDDIYYDERARLETICREANEQAWGKRYKYCYMAVTKVTMAQLSIVCAASDFSVSESKLAKNASDFIAGLAAGSKLSQLGNGIKEVRLREVTLNAFMTAFNDNALAKLFSEKSLFLEKIKLNEDKKCYKEYLLGLEFWDKNNPTLDAGILPEEERERIRQGKKISKPVVQPVHYAIYGDEAESVKLMVQELLHALCVKGRICSRRLVKIDESNFLDLLLDGSIQNLNVLDGGGVIVILKKGDSSRVIKRLLQAVYSAENLYSEKFTAMIVLPAESEEAGKCLREYCPQWSFVEIRSRKLEMQYAAAYFRNLMDRDGLAAECGDWQQILGEKDSYTNSEVLMLYKMWVRNTYNIEKHFPQYKETVQAYFEKRGDIQDAKTELERLIGLVDVKRLIAEIIDFFKLQKRRAIQHKGIAKPTMHMVFYGNPGTAKTTVARLVGRILKEEKILEIGDMYEVGRADLVGKYVGWTAKTVREYFEKAKGSVLFIDEAYSLVDGQNSFGDEAIDTIVQEMENHRNDMVVIMAGYKHDMEELIQKNQGLQSRISFYIEFPDYSREELYCIMEKMVSEEGMELAEDVKETFLDRVGKMDIRTGNGRLVRNLLDRAKIKQAGRILGLPEELQEEEMFRLRGADF